MRHGNAQRFSHSSSGVQNRWSSTPAVRQWFHVCGDPSRQLSCSLPWLWSQPFHRELSCARGSLLPWNAGPRSVADGACWWRWMLPWIVPRFPLWGLLLLDRLHDTADAVPATDGRHWWHQARWLISRRLHKALSWFQDSCGNHTHVPRCWASASRRISQHTTGSFSTAH